MRDGGLSQCDIFNVQLLVHCVSEMLLCNKICLTIHPVNNAVFPADLILRHCCKFQDTMLCNVIVDFAVAVHVLQLGKSPKAGWVRFCMCNHFPMYTELQICSIPCHGGHKHYPLAQSQGHHTINRLEEKGVERGSARQSTMKGWERAIR